MIIVIKPNFTTKNHEQTERFHSFECKSKARNHNSNILFTIRNKCTWFLNFFICVYCCHTISNTIDVKEVKRQPCTHYIQAKFPKVYTRSLKYLQIWILLVLLLPTQQKVSGHGMFRQTLNLNESSLSHNQNPNMQIRISPLKNLYEVDSLKTNQLQSKMNTKISRTETVLNNLTKKISKQIRASFYNVSSNIYSLINISQSNNMPHTINQKIAVAWNNTLPIHNRQKRQTRDIQIKAKSHNRQIKQMTNLRRVDEARLKRLVLKGLGMKKIPDMSKVNISQVEYYNKYIEYLNRLRNNQEKVPSYYNNYGASSMGDLNLLSIVTNKFNDISHRRWRHKRSLKNISRLRQTKTQNRNEELKFNQPDKTNILLHFPLTNIKDAKIYHDKIDEANVRLMLLYSSSLAQNSRRWQGPKKRKFSHVSGNDNSVNIVRSCHSDEVKSNQFKKVRIRQLNLKVYQLLTANRRRLLASRKIEFENIGLEETRTQWIEFDVTKAVQGWLNKTHENLGIEIQCDRCKSVGARILSESSPSTESSSAKSTAQNNENFNLMPVLNIIGHGSLNSHQEDNLDIHHIMLTNNRSEDYVHHRSDHGTSWRKDKWSNNCYKVHQRCCRNQLDVAFKDIKGFEFILQPKVFDAGYCHGRCPPRHNPAHHHALLQSLIWQEDHSRAPRPCCAPSKLEMLEILHVDEVHSDKLKISTWSDMQVIECACS
ncbi:uncharacterized protein LOC108039247 [Drosophila rhopaloa]|uniref:TGF-beta family profile domain-containing protein n=1 Tax=Drosophila rhopaloa TaxID=1041015 RepID=A0ABM5GYG0_DRORH|nr:uncharacterized protein LOC108039247 [Drosophila rhopaloa]